MDKNEAIENLQEVSELIEQAIDLAQVVINDSELRENGNGRDLEAAYCYWYAQLQMARSSDHSFIGSASVTIEDTIQVLGENGTD